MNCFWRMSQTVPPPPHLPFGVISLYGEQSCQRASVPTNLLLAACGPFVWVILTWAAAQAARGVSCEFTCNSSSLSPPVIEEIFSASGPLENHQPAFQLNVRWGGLWRKAPLIFKERIGVVPSAVVRMRKSSFLSEFVIAPQSVFEY